MKLLDDDLSIKEKRGVLLLNIHGEENMSEDILEKIEYYKLACKTFEENENVIQTLVNSGANKSTSIELAYELQAAGYTRNFNELALRRNTEIHKIINQYVSLSDVTSVAVLGVGEAKNWIGYEGEIEEFFGLELSYSRLRYAHENLTKVPGIKNFSLLKGDATQTVFQENAVDLSITLHSIEPNGNTQGTLMLENVIECSSKYVLLFEPDFPTAPPEMQERMLKHDYVQNIDENLSKMDSIIVREKFVMDIQETDNNLTTCWVVEKKVKTNASNKLVCPFSGCQLTEYANFLYSSETGLAFPWLGNFRCLNKADAIFIGMAE